LEAQNFQAEFLKVSKFQSIRTKIIVFSLLAAIIPSLLLGWLSYLQSSKLLREKIAQELGNATNQTAKELDLWLKERQYDLRVFSNSYIIKENLNSIQDKQLSGRKASTAFDQIKGYLDSVAEKFGVYEHLTLVDSTGEILATTSDDAAHPMVPGPWQKRLRASPPSSAIAEFPPYIGSDSLYLAVDISSPGGYPLGILVAKINLDVVASILQLGLNGDIRDIYLVRSNGAIWASSSPLDGHRMVDMPERFDSPGDYHGYHGQAVIGMARRLSSLQWVIMAEMDKDKAYADVNRLRRVIAGIVAILALCIGLCGFVFGYTVVRPVERLSMEAARVASGNLEVDIPVAGLSEVSYLTQVFNHMVASLRKGREEVSVAHESLLESNKKLHRLSITDDLTGLYNRKHILDLLSREITKSRMNAQSFSILLIDIDFFKKINDTYGHQAGDAVLCRLAESMRNAIRGTDHVGRYGGEEFLIILPGSDLQTAAATAERIRQKVSDQSRVVGDATISVTLSMGISHCPGDGEDVASIIRTADKALYQAKANGRNAVIFWRDIKDQSVAEAYRPSASLRLIS